MRTVSAIAMISTTALAVATLAATSAAATTIHFNADATSFVFPAGPGVTSRSITLTGVVSYPSGLPDGTYGLGLGATWSIDLHRAFTTATDSFWADYHFSTADLSALSITFSGGLPAADAGTFTFTPKLPDSFNNPVLGSAMGITLLAGGVDEPWRFYIDQTLVARGEGSVTSVSSGVPEPESWGMMVAGFGLTGALARRRRASCPT